MKGRTLDSKVDSVFARNTFEWLPGGFFLKSIFDGTFLEAKIWSLELIGYDPKSGTFPSTVYSNLVGFPLPYRYEVKGKNVKITTGFGGGFTMTGKISEDGNSFSGGWRPNKGKESAENPPYDFVATRVK